MGVAVDDLASIVEATMRGMQGASRASAAAAAAASVRVATELLLGQAEPSQVDEETKERVKAITPVVRQHVMAGSHDLRASIPGAARKLRNRASHHAFGAGPGAWKHELLEAASRPTSRSASGNSAASAAEERGPSIRELLAAHERRLCRLEQLAAPDALGVWYADSAQGRGGPCGGGVDEGHMAHNHGAEETKGIEAMEEAAVPAVT